jgi:hypothetical protein
MKKEEWEEEEEGELKFTDFGPVPGTTIKMQAILVHLSDIIIPAL